MLVSLALAAVVGLTLGFVVKRLRDLNALSVWVWPLMVAAAIAPIAVSYLVLNPGAPVDTAEVAAEKDQVSLTIPPGHSIMVTAVLTEETDEPGNDKTHYNLQIRGKGWEESADGTMKRESAKGGVEIDAMGDEAITETGGTRKGKWGEDLQDRVDLGRDGEATVTVTNWQGTAAEKLVLEVVPSPPADWMMWGYAALITFLSLILTVRDNAERLASDLAFLALWAVFLRDGVTPNDDVQGVVLALVPAALTAWLGVAAVEYLVIQYFTRGTDTDDAEGDAPAAEAKPVEAAPAAPTKRRGGAAARRRAQQQASGQDGE